MIGVVLSAVLSLPWCVSGSR